MPLEGSVFKYVKIEKMKNHWDFDLRFSSVNARTKDTSEFDKIIRDQITSIYV